MLLSLFTPFLPKPPTYNTSGNQPLENQTCFQDKGENRKTGRKSTNEAIPHPPTGGTGRRSTMNHSASGLK